MIDGRLSRSPRWHDDRLWFSDWGAQEVVAVDLEGMGEVIARMPSSSFSIDWVPDGRLLIVSGPEGVLLRREADGSLVTHADLSGLSDHPWNDIVVDGRGNAYIGNIGFDFPGGEPRLTQPLLRPQPLTLRQLRKPPRKNSSHEAVPRVKEAEPLVPPRLALLLTK